MALTKERLQSDWVIDWLSDPQKIMPGTKMPAPYLPDQEILSFPDAISDWGSHVMKLDGNQDLMLRGLRDYIYSIKGQVDISSEIQN